jgi:hypothetical protein
MVKGKWLKEWKRKKLNERGAEVSSAYPIELLKPLKI